MDLLILEWGFQQSVNNVKGCFSMPIYFSSAVRKILAENCSGGALPENKIEGDGSFLLFYTGRTR
jgi:hypothetical protein